MVLFRSFPVILISFIASGVLSGQSFNEKRFFQKSCPVNREVTLEVINKYGAVNITPWGKDSISVKAEIEVSATNLERLRKMMEGIEIDFSETSFSVRVETQFDQTINMLFESFKGMTDKLIPYDSRVQINYFINVPRYLNLRITNKYGNVSMENSTGNFRLNLSNGSLKAGSLEVAENIELAFCDAAIANINKGQIDATFSEVKIDESKDLVINSISSRFDLEMAERLNADSKRDNFFIGTVKSLKGTSYFTDFRIDELENEISLDTRYGSVRASLLKKSMETVSITSGYTDIDLTFDPAASYSLEIRHANTFLVLPVKNSRIQKKSLDDDKKEYITSGTVGRNPENIKVTIDATRGNIYIK